MARRWLRAHDAASATPVEPVEDDVDRFAADLRTLRAEAGSPTLAALDRQTGISKSVLSDAFAGKALPSERTVHGVASALGADPQEWLRRRQALEAGTRPARSGQPAAPATVRRRAAVAAAVACFAAGAVVASGVTWLVVHETSAETEAGAEADATDAARVSVQAGTDPARTPCVDDAVVTASVTRALDTQLQIIWSEACQAAWARITRYDGAATGNAVSASVFRQIAPTAADRQDTTEPDAQSAYTTLIVRTAHDVRLCATGSLTVDGDRVHLGDPICM